MRGFLSHILIVFSTLFLTSLSSCQSVDDERIPNVAVNINLGDAALWNTYGVAGYGMSRNFIYSLNQPAGFHYNVAGATGFGGVLLINGMDPFTNDTNVPLAYDLACPVECKRDVRVAVEGDLYEAVCPKCNSHYDVTMQGGAPVSGPAATGKTKLGLRRYQCLPTYLGGYYISN